MSDCKKLPLPDLSNGYEPKDPGQVKGGENDLKADPYNTDPAAIVPLVLVLPEGNHPG
jgi:hypothetical protein